MRSADECQGSNVFGLPQNTEMVSSTVLVLLTDSADGRFEKTVEITWTVRDEISNFKLKIFNFKAGLPSLDDMKKQLSAALTC